MPKRKLEQFHQENATWLRTLDYMEQEIAFMKNRLSKMIDMYHTAELLDWAEEYHNQVLLKEEAIDLLKQDLQAQEKRLTSDYLFEGNLLKDEIAKAQTQLRLQMNYMETDFFQMRKTFNEFMVHHMMQ